MNEIQKAHKRREYVNMELRKRTQNRSVTNKQKTKLLKSLWREARRKYS